MKCIITYKLVCSKCGLLETLTYTINSKINFELPIIDFNLIYQKYCSRDRSLQSFKIQNADVDYNN